MSLKPERLEALGATSALELNVRALMPYLNRDGVTELCINQPRVAYLETSLGWVRESLPFADFDWCRRLSKLVANSTRQRIDEESPLLSASLPSGERIQLVMPPATSPQCVAMSIRKPAQAVWTIQELSASGIFKRARASGVALDDTEAKLSSLLRAQSYEEFMRLAVVSRKNIVVSGPTGSGKTTWTKALIREIPSDERLITIEDAQELILDEHPNHVRLF
jgi:type IV secretion system protein VirB11